MPIKRVSGSHLGIDQFMSIRSIRTGLFDKVDHSNSSSYLKENALMTLYTIVNICTLKAQ